LKYLKILGWIALYMLIYLVSSIASGFLLGIAYFFRSIISRQIVPFESFLAENMSAMLIFSGILTLGFGFLVLMLRKQNPFRYLEFRAMPIKHTAITAVMGAGFAFFVNSLLTLVEIEKFLPDYVSDPLLEMMTSNLFLTFLAIGIIVPIYEEVLVRGLVFKELRNALQLWVALLIQGFIFGLMHGNMLQFSYAFPMGVLLGYVYVKYRSIWAPILIHLVWNSTSLLMGLLLPEVSSIVFILFLIGGGIIFISGTIYTIFLKPVNRDPVISEQLQ